MRETEVHRDFSHWLNKQHIPFTHSRTDKKTSTKCGDPDFCLTFCGRVIFVEVKVGRNRLSDAQKKRIAYLRQSGCEVFICRSIEECLATVQNWLGVVNGSANERALNLGHSDSGSDAGKGTRYIKHDWDSLKRAVAETNGESPVNGNCDSCPKPGDSKRLFIGNFRGEDYVFQQITPGSNNVIMLHKADSHDLQTLPHSLDSL